MTYAVRFTAGAVRDLQEIDDWISANDGPAKAAHVVERIEATVATLKRFPDRGAHPGELLALGIRAFRETHFKPYRIIYRVDARKVHVVVIADGRRDMQSLLSARLLGVEIYTDDRIQEFDSAEADLEKAMGRPTRPKPRRRG